MNTQNSMLKSKINILNLDGIVVYDFTNLNLQENSRGNCFGCDSCDSSCDQSDNCDCDCDSKW